MSGILPEDGIPGPHVAEPATVQITLHLSERQAVYLRDIAGMLDEISDHGRRATIAGGMLLLALADPEIAGVAHRLSHQLRVQAGTA